MAKKVKTVEGTTSAAAVRALAAQFVARSIAQGMKGKARDRAAVEFTVGAAALAHCIGDAPLYRAASLLAFLTATRGFSEVQRHANHDAAQEVPTASALADAKLGGPHV